MTQVTNSRSTPIRSQGTPVRTGRAAGLAASIDPVRVLRRHVLGLVLSAIIGAVVGVVAYFGLARLYPLYSDNVLFEVQPGISQASDVSTYDSTNDEWVFRIAQTETFVLKSVDVLDREAGRIPERGLERLGALRVVVGQDHCLAPGMAGSQAGDRLAHRPDTDQQDPHGRLPPKASIQGNTPPGGRRVSQPRGGRRAYSTVNAARIPAA